LQTTPSWTWQHQEENLEEATVRKIYFSTWKETNLLLRIFGPDMNKWAGSEQARFGLKGTVHLEK
jgi:hypothetical protein